MDFNIHVFLTGVRDLDCPDKFEVVIKEWKTLTFICPDTDIKRIDISLSKIHVDMISFFIKHSEFKLQEIETEGLRTYTTFIPCEKSEVKHIYEHILNFVTSLQECEKIEKNLSFKLEEIQANPEYRCILDMCVIGSFLGNINSLKAISFEDGEE